MLILIASVVVVVFSENLHEYSSQSLCSFPKNIQEHDSDLSSLNQARTNVDVMITRHKESVNFDLDKIILV